MKMISPERGLQGETVETRESFVRKIEFKMGNVRCELFIERGTRPNAWIVEKFEIHGEDSVTKSLLDYLPKGWKIILDEDLSGNVETVKISTQEIVVPYGSLQESEVFIGLFHEFGHVQHPNNHNLPEDPWSRSAEMYLRDREWKIVPEERDSWAFCIRELRALKRKGFDFGDIMLRENLTRIIDRALRSYRDPRKLTGEEKEGTY